MPPIRVMFRYDTEEFTVPSCHDVIRDIALTLSAAHFTGTFITVGELARTWEREGRADVIDAVGKHDVGCHTNLHSVHPLPPLYCEGKSWREAVGEVVTREGQGVRDLRRLFNRTPTCFIQAGAAWTPAFLGAMREWGIPTFWDARSYHSYVTLDEKPFWLSGILNFTTDVEAPRANHLCLAESEGGVEKALADFRAAAARLDPAGGTVGIGSHPGNLSTLTSWDVMTCWWGANVPREAWRQPPLKSEETVAANLRALAAFAEALAQEPGVVSASVRDMPGLYRDRAQGAEFGPQALGEIADALASEITFIPAPGCPTGTYLTPAEAVLLLSGLALDVAVGQGARPQRLTAAPCGPERRVESRLGGARTIEGRRARRMVTALFEFISRYSVLPSSVETGGVTLGPAEYTATLCGAVPALLQGEVPDNVELRTAPFTLERYDTSDQADWGWSIYPVGFDAPDGRELARLQTWSLKPAAPVA